MEIEEIYGEFFPKGVPKGHHDYSKENAKISFVQTTRYTLVKGTANINSKTLRFMGSTRPLPPEYADIINHELLGALAHYMNKEASKLRTRIFQIINETE